MMRENRAFRFYFTGFLLVTNLQQTRTRKLGPVAWVDRDSDGHPTSTQLLKAFEDENFASISLWRGLVILSVLAMAARAFEPN